MKILICSPDGSTLAKLTEALPDYDVITAATGQECLNAGPVVAAFLSQDIPDIMWDNLVSVFAQQNIPVYLLGATSLDILQTLLQAGGKGIIPPTPEEIIKVLNRLSGSAALTAPAGAATRNRPLRAKLESNPSRPVIKQEIQPKNTLTLPSRVNTETKLHSKKLVVFYAFKGGVGKSILSASTAVALANNKVKRLSVCVVDFDPYNGDIAKIFNIQQSCSIIDWLAREGEDLRDYLVDHPSGVKILPGPANPLDGLAIGKGEAEKILSVLTRRFDVVVVDTSHVPRDSVIVSIENATHVFMTGLPNRVTLQDNDNISKTFRKAQVDMSEFNLIINRMPKKAPLRLTDYADVLPWDIKMIIPDDPAVDRIINAGGLPVLDRRSKAFNQSIMQIANIIEPMYVEQKKFTLSLPKLFSKKAVN